MIEYNLYPNNSCSVFILFMKKKVQEIHLYGGYTCESEPIHMGIIR